MPIEHTRDWSTLLPAERPPNGQLDQAFQLPDIECYALYRFPCVLKHPSHYEEWRKEIFYTLKMHNLHRLIDSTIPRPYKDSPNARQWQQMSIEVRNWIAWNVDPILVRMIVKELPRAQLADEFMMGADMFLKQFNRSPPEHFEDISSVLFKFIQCERSDYPTARAFVYGIMQKYTHTLNMKMGIPPFVPMLMLLTEIEADVGKAFVTVRYEQLEKMDNIVQDVTKGYFENVYFDVLEYLDSLEQPGRSIEEL